MAIQGSKVAAERDKAFEAEQATARTAATLARALRESNIERGRTMGSTGNTALAGL